MQELLNQVAKIQRIYLQFANAGSMGVSCKGTTVISQLTFIVLLNWEPLCYISFVDCAVSSNIDVLSLLVM